ncbi:MAG: GGDEF domain-containing protein [Chloroflexi bacterium]|nr:MAG: GGDEF domain-containing protein [Chloroflexota bacterium]MBL1196610.1 GGDEF domain-containing protein [Chloroflexota bacterium]NOH13905.1 GGDEF domain-containing protein [Chloroflexota bacterium]
MKRFTGVSLQLRLINHLGVFGATALTSVFAVLFSVSITAFVLHLNEAPDYSMGLTLSVVIPTLLAPVFAYTTYQLVDRLNKQDRLLRTYAQEDALTGLFNRRYFTELAEKEIVRAKRYSLPVSMIMLDIDGFKNINDQHGHLVGDDVLRSIGKKLRETFRASDIVGRFGGDEFIILLPHTDEQQALESAQRIQDSLGEYAANGNSVDIHYETSLGVSTLQDAKQNFDELVRIADHNMYTAKRT